MSSSLIAAGLGVAALGFGGRAALRHWRTISKTMNKTLDSIPGGAVRFHNKCGRFWRVQFSKYYAGGFEKEMSKREASLILGVSPSSNQERIKKAFKRIMIANHPDRGGSPYVAGKINQAKDLLDKPGRSAGL